MAIFSRIWNWLLGRDGEKIANAPITESPKIKLSVKEKKPKYQSIPRTKEVKDYVESIVKKAQSKDPEPKPYKPNVDEEAVKKFVDKLQGRK